MFSFTFQLPFGRKTYRTVIIAVFILLSLSTFSQEYKTIKAQKGDGIYSVLKQNGLPPAEYLDQFIELNKTKLGKDNSLIIGKTYRLPVIETKNIAIQEPPPVAENSQEKIVYEIFGNKYKEITIKSRELSKAVYYLMSGHGGPDPGAVGKLYGQLLCEDEYAYDVTLRLARNLIERGATVYMIIRDPNDGIRDEQFLKPDKDEVCFPNSPIPLNQVARLHQGTEAVNKLYAQNKGKYQRLVVIHVDSRSQKENIDVFFYHDKRSDTGKKMAITLKETFGQKYARHQPNRGYGGSVTDRNLYVIKNSFPPSVFIELGNINHTRDQQRFILSDNRQAVANWLRDGIVEDYKKSIK
ncbi:MAG TPA: N-acetylmuramoyl-L-alanine amidase [Prolixibacteraceae bacterium]|nr:N-acetylmuramoyl-L-alanine amidase [Prolixibacteraceae bacterium]